MEWRDTLTGLGVWYVIFMAARSVLDESKVTGAYIRAVSIRVRSTRMGCTRISLCRLCIMAEWEHRIESQLLKISRSISLLLESFRVA